MDTLFFILSKVLWALVSPASVLLLIAASAWLSHRLGWWRISRALCLTDIVLVLLIGFFPVGAWIVYPLEHRYSMPASTDIPDGLIVLGGAWRPQGSAYWNQWELNHAAERELALLALARRFPDAQLVFTGGSGRLLDQDHKEAAIAKSMYADLGLDLDRLILESESRNTYENALFSKRLVEPVEDESWWLITSAYHMPRALGAFCAQQWSVQPYPVDHFYEPGVLRPNWAFADHLWELERVAREWLGLLVYRLTGKSDSGC